MHNFETGKEYCDVDYIKKNIDWFLNRFQVSKDFNVSVDDNYLIARLDDIEIKVNHSEMTFNPPVELCINISVAVKGNVREFTISITNSSPDEDVIAEFCNILNVIYYVVR